MNAQAIQSKEPSVPNEYLQALAHINDGLAGGRAARFEKELFIPHLPFCMGKRIRLRLFAVTPVGIFRMRSTINVCVCCLESRRIRYPFETIS